MKVRWCGVRCSFGSRFHEPRGVSGTSTMHDHTTCTLSAPARAPAPATVHAPSGEAPSTPSRRAPSRGEAPNRSEPRPRESSKSKEPNGPKAEFRKLRGRAAAARRAGERKGTKRRSASGGRAQTFVVWSNATRPRRTKSERTPPRMYRHGARECPVAERASRYLNPRLAASLGGSLSDVFGKTRK
eukprot:3665358-Prymnesium_polylepis.1